MNRTCGEPSAYEMTHSPEFADYHEPEPEDIEAELEALASMEPEQ